MNDKIDIEDLKRRLTQNQYSKNANHTHKCSQLLTSLTYFNKYGPFVQENIIKSCLNLMLK